MLRRSFLKAVASLAALVAPALALGSPGRKPLATRGDRHFADKLGPGEVRFIPCWIRGVDLAAPQLALIVQCHGESYGRAFAITPGFLADPSNIATVLVTADGVEFLAPPPVVDREEDLRAIGVTRF
jgi:hypothetical protein